MLSVEWSSCLLGVGFANVFDRPVVVGLYIVPCDPEGNSRTKPVATTSTTGKTRTVKAYGKH